MKIKDKIQYLYEQDSHLTEKELSQINHLYKKVHARRKAQTESIEVLSDALFTYSDLLGKKMDLLKLQELFSKYIGQKGLKQSLLKVEELVHLISNDIQDTNHVLEETNLLIGGIKDFILQTQSKEEGKEQ